MLKMGKILVLTEKPSVARDIAKVLKCTQKGKGYIEGSRHIITWALGHLITLAQPEAYGKQYQAWRIEDLPMLPKRMDLTVIGKTAPQFKVVKSLMQRKDIDELVIATDAGREGELVARWIMEKAGYRKGVKRLWISSQTDRAIKEGFNQLKPGKLYEPLYISAKSRAEADWLVGLNVTRALTCKYNAQLSAGRVQTPTLAMIVQREEEIRKFVPKPYCTIEVKTDGFHLLWQDKNSGQIRIFDETQAQKILDNVNRNSGTVIAVKKSARKELPPFAYDLTELQRDANRRYGYSPKQTLSVMQNLYERHKLVTYPRTDSKHITTDMVSTLPERLNSIAIGPYKQMVHAINKGKINTSKRLVDNSKVTDHHAIIPTEQYVDLGALNKEERNIYDLITKRFIAVLSPVFEYEQTVITVEISGETFTAKGKVIKSKGWKSVYDNNDAFEEDIDEEDISQALPSVNKGEKIQVRGINMKEGKTKPPARYTEATLLSAMEHPEKFVDNKAFKETLSSAGGLGTPATRADIIEKLFNAFYIEKHGKEIVPTSKGQQLISLVPSDLKSPVLTAKWEQKLTEISKSKMDARLFIDDMKEYATKMVKTVIHSSAQYKHTNLTGERCEQCGKNMLEVNGKKGKMYICKDRACGNRKMIAQKTNARCPTCHKKLELRGEGEGKIFICPCGFREKLSAFEQRKKSQKSGLDKKQVKQYLKKQDTKEPINSALADALAKWKQ